MKDSLQQIRFYKAESYWPRKGSRHLFRKKLFAHRDHRPHFGV